MARGRAATPELERARREKIRQAVKRRVQYRDSKGRFMSRGRFLKELPREGAPEPRFRRAGRGIRTLIVSDYRLRNLPTSPQLQNWNYVVGHEYVTYIDPNIASNPSALQAHLNYLHPNRVHYRARVVEFL